MTSVQLLEHAYLLESCMRGKAGLESLQLFMQACDLPTGLVHLGLSTARFLPCLLQRSDYSTTANRTQITCMQAPELPTGLVHLGLSTARFRPCLEKRLQ